MPFCGPQKRKHTHKNHIFEYESKARPLAEQMRLQPPPERTNTANAQRAARVWKVPRVDIQDGMRCKGHPYNQGNPNLNTFPQREKTHKRAQKAYIGITATWQGKCVYSRRQNAWTQQIHSDADVETLKTQYRESWVLLGRWRGRMIACTRKCCLGLNETGKHI